MKERPILFSGPMIRAILAGGKTQTRRVVRKQFGPNAIPAEMCAETAEGWQTLGHSGRWWDDAAGLDEDAINCPFGVPGDRLWVRETWNWEKNAIGAMRDEDGPFAYAASPMCGSSIDGKWRPSIHMPRFASRITLEVTGVRVERLQEICEADARAEGAIYGPLLPMGFNWAGCDPDDSVMRSRFAVLWHGINAARGFGWDANPWVWVVQFKCIGGEA